MWKIGCLGGRSVDDWVSASRNVELAGARFNGWNRKTCR